MTLLASTAGDAAYWGLAIFLVAIGLASAFMLFRLGQAFERLSSLHQGHRARPPARDREGRARPSTASTTSSTRPTRSPTAPSRWPTAPTPPCARSRP